MLSLENLKKLYPIQIGQNNSVLRNKSTKILNINSDIIKFSNILKKLMFEYDGIGLAAPQIGENISMISVTKCKLGGKIIKIEKVIIMLNPEIIEFSKESDIQEEGCLSFPGLFGDVKRSKEIVVRYNDLKGKEIIIKLNSYNARIVQHEVDHLNGILLPDKIINKAEVDIDKCIKNLL